MQRAARFDTAINASVSAPQLGVLQAQLKNAPCTNPDERALNLVRSTYLEYLLQSEHAGHFERGSLLDLAAQAMDRSELDIEDHINRIALTQKDTPAKTPEETLDHDAMIAFSEVIDKRQWAERNIRLAYDFPTSAFRNAQMPSERIVTDRYIRESVSGVFAQKLFRALAFIQFPGELRPQGPVFPQHEDLCAALARIPKALAQWQTALCEKLLTPINDANRNLAEREVNDTSKTLVSLLDLSPAALAEKLDTLDACAEDALSFACQRALESTHSEHMGIAIARWQSLSAHLDARARHLHQAKASLAELSAMVAKAKPDLSNEYAVLCGLMLKSSTIALLQRSLASSMLLGLEGKDTLPDAWARLMSLGSGTELAGQLDDSAEFCSRIARVFPGLNQVLKNLMPLLEQKGMRLDQHPRELGIITQLSVLKMLAEQNASAVAHCAQLRNDCRNTLLAHRESWQDSPGQLLIQHIRQTSSDMLPKLESLEETMKSLASDLPPGLLNILTCGALNPVLAPRDCAKRAFDWLKKSEPPLLDTLRQQWLDQTLKLKPDLRVELARLRREEPAHQVALARILEPLTDRVRDEEKRLAALDAKSAKKKSSDDDLLEAAIAQANQEREAAKSSTDVDDAPMTQQDAYQQLDEPLNWFLKRMPRTVSDNKRLDALSHYLTHEDTDQLMMLALNIVSRSQYLALTGSPEPYKPRNTIAEKWLAMVLPGLNAMDEVSSPRLTAGQMRARLLKDVISFDQNNPTACANAEKLINHWVLSTTRLCDMVISMKNTGATAAAQEENILRATTEAREQFETYSKHLLETPLIGDVLYNAWLKILDAHIGQYDTEAPLSQSIFEPVWPQKNARYVSEATDRLMTQNRAELDAFKKDGEAVKHLERLVATSGIDMRTGYMASPGLVTMHQLTIKLLANLGVHQAPNS
jgi:hypothetical protein